MAALLEFRDVRYEIESREILRGVSLEVDEGETVVLLGRSGSGKTTLLKTVNRLVEPSCGEILFDDKPVRLWDPVRLRRSIGYVIQEGGLFPHYTVEENVGVVPRLERWPQDRIRERVAQLLELVGLTVSRYGSRLPRQLSGGEKQRVGIARALAADPPLMLLDEPFAALDPVTRFELQQQFLELRRTLGKTALFVTHDVREALMMGSRIALLKEGRLEIVAEPDDFLRSTVPEARAFLRSVQDERRMDESQARQ